jgi:hypothetical protein
MMTPHHITLYLLIVEINECKTVDTRRSMSEKHASNGDQYEPGLYEIRIKGHLDDRWSDWFGGLTITLEDDGETLLTGPVPDQAALHGLLKKVRDVGIALVSVNPLQPGPADKPDGKALTGAGGLPGPQLITTRRIEMNTYRMNAVMAGALYLLGSVFGVMGGVFGGKVLVSLIAGTPPAGAELLSIVAADSSRLTMGAFLTLMMGISLAAMTVFLYPVFRKDSHELAMGMVLFRGALEGAGYFVTALGLLTLAALGTDAVASGADPAALKTIGNILYRFLDLKTPISTIFFIIGAACLYISFYRTRLIPRWLTIWGLIGAVPYLANAFLHFFQVETSIGTYLEIPLGIQELVMGLWLITKGFHPSAVAALFVKTE